ncbi:hypothetical protein SCP_1501920 [Sparassis crispa]|uniref:Thioester reductase (TE) domain-containing protein n=1 Tax=Sparassis crispa TaxID=139825 RepID=A0A401H441_9APHY|nr:hypothetical protein SCP_1501920 [Sparassis crispa]GBE89184.1 hypothetical protein SCP_1501920 [Sparassis crispa]
MCPWTSITQRAVVLVTGTTGNLGAYILAELIVNPHIARVYTHNRGIADRQRAAFEGSHLPAKLLADPKLPHVSAAVQLAGLAPGARFLFTSSVSIAQAWRPSGGRGSIPESSLKDPSFALGHLGYGMSKFVVEEVLSNASKTGNSGTGHYLGL